METEKFKLGFLERISLKYFSWKVGGGGKKVFEEVADLICHLFADEPNLDPRDLAAGLVLLYQSRDEVDPGANRSGHLLGDAPRPLLHRGPVEALEHWDSARRVSDTLEYASAAYKIEDKEQRSLTQKVKDGFKWIFRFLKTNEQKVLKALPHLKNKEDFLHLTELNDPLQTPFFVAADPRHKTVVVSIRGTQTPQDVLTDVNASPASVKAILMKEGLEDLAQAIEGIDGYFAHQGMIKSAVFVYKQIVEKGVAEKVKTKFADHQLIVTGHSLGAGTAVLASFLLKRHFENLRCLAFSPPGGLLSEPARAASEAFALSVTLGEDIVGRLSLDSFKKLKNMALEKRATSDRSNAAILASNALTSGIATLGHWVKSWFVSSKDPYTNVVPEEEVVPYSIDWTAKLLLPGRIWHLETSLPNDEDVRVVGVRLRRSSDFKDVIIGPTMLDDHKLGHVGKLMKMLASAKKTENVEADDANE